MKEKKYDEWFPCYQHPPQGEIVLTICEIYGDKGRYVYRANMINSLDKWNWTDDGSGTGIIPVCWCYHKYPPPPKGIDNISGEFG